MYEVRDTKDVEGRIWFRDKDDSSGVFNNVLRIV